VDAILHSAVYKVITNVDAAEYLANLYLCGEGVPKDPVRAYHLLSLSTTEEEKNLRESIATELGEIPVYSHLSNLFPWLLT